MRKEVVIAIILGFIVGLFIAYGIYTANKAVKQNATLEPISQSNESLASSTPIASPGIILLLDEPEANILLQDKTATVSGQTDPETAVAILAEGQEELLLSDKQGLFSTTINLISGENEINVIATNKAGEQIEKTIKVVYSTAKIE